MHKLIKLPLLATSIAVLAACGGSNDSSSKSAELTFAVSDSPAALENVVIAFKSVAIKRVSGSGEAEEEQEEQAIKVQNNNGENTDYRQVDLLKFQGSDAAELFSGITVEPGDYQMCIYITDGTGSQSTQDSYVVDDKGVKGLRTPSNGSCAGFKPDDQLDTGRLKTKTFTVNEGRNYLVAEFDLMKVLKQPVGNKDYWTLKPNGYELVHAKDVGSITGTIDESIIDLCQLAVGGSEFTSKVYLYPGTVTLENMGDFRADDAAQAPDMIAPVASALVNSDEIPENGIEYNYEFGFVKEGDYSIGYTCNDDPEAVDENVISAAIQNVAVIAEQTTSADTITEPGE